MVRMTGGAPAASAAPALSQTAAKNELTGVIFSALDLAKPTTSAGGTDAAGLLNPETLNKIIILIDKLTTLSGNINRIAEKMTAKKAEPENNNVIDATITEKQEQIALGEVTAGGEQSPEQTSPQFAAAAVAIRKLSDENAILRYKLSERQFSPEKLDQYLEMASLIIPDDMPFREVKQKIRDNLPLIMKFAGGKNE